MLTRKLIARNAHAITRCARVIRSVHLNESERNYVYFSTRVEPYEWTNVRLTVSLTGHRKRLPDIANTVV